MKDVLWLVAEPWFKPNTLIPLLDAFATQTLCPHWGGKECFLVPEQG